VEDQEVLDLILENSTFCPMANVNNNIPVLIDKYGDAFGKDGIWCEKCGKTVDECGVNFHPKTVHVGWDMSFAVETGERTFTVKCHGEQVQVHGYLQQDGTFRVDQVKEVKIVSSKQA